MRSWDQGVFRALSVAIRNYASRALHRNVDQDADYFYPVALVIESFDYRGYSLALHALQRPPESTRGTFKITQRRKHHGSPCLNCHAMQTSPRTVILTSLGEKESKQETKGIASRKERDVSPLPECPWSAITYVVN